MIKVMIVEDEPFVRMGLRNIVHQNEMGFNVCAEANNGIEALKLLSERHPDIIMLDIKMPQMDGIEFLKEKKKMGDTTPVIVLSCHGEYEYVREAMKLGAKDYILKLSAKPQDLLALLEQVRMDTGITLNNDPLADNMTETSSLLRSVCIGGETTERLHELASYDNAGISAQSNYVVDMLLDSRCKVNLDFFGDMEKNLLPDETVTSLLSTVLERKGAFFRAGEGEFILVFPKRQSNDSEARELCRELRNQLEFYFSSTAFFGISSTGILDGLREATAKSRQYASLRFYLGPDSIVTESDLTFCEYGILPSDLTSESEMVEAVLSRDRSKMVQIMSDVLAVIRNVRPEPSIAVIYLIEINILIMSYARKVIKPPISLSSDLIEFIRSCQTLDEISEGIKQFLGILFDHLQGKWKKRLRVEIADAMKYISEHYTENISLHDMATRFHLSTSRFCVVFREGTGETFLDYLNLVRIRKAEELLLQSNLSIYEVAYQVGFNSTNYFSKLFKRIAGKQPSEYRQ
jgi:two-component system, response regulator YesN